MGREVIGRILACSLFYGQAVLLMLYWRHMEGIIFLTFGLLSSLYSAVPLLIIALIVIWLARKSNNSRPHTPVVQPNEAASAHYERGVRDALTQVETLKQIDAAELQRIERVLLPTAYQSPTNLAAPHGPQSADITPPDDMEVEPEVYDEDTDERHDTVISPVAEPSRAAMAPPTMRSAKQTTFNGLNVLLLLSSLLFVAAGIAFIASPFADGVKLAVLMAIVGLFYGGGLGLYQTVHRLRPAAVAFVGTGLALIPFLGVAFAQYTSFAAAVIWLLISLIGVGAYLFAALVLKSQVVSYLTIAFVLSLAASAVANVHAPVSGYFVAMIGVSLTASVVARWRPEWIPAVFRAPVEQTGAIVTPAALGASLLFGGPLRLLDYEIIFALTTLHYIVARLQTGRSWYEQVARALAQVTLLLVAGDLTNGNLAHFGIVFVIVAASQVGSSQLYWQKASSVHARTTELTWMWIGMGLQIIAPLLWMSEPGGHRYTLIALVLLAVTCATTLWRTKRYEFGFVLVYAGLAIPGALASTLLPLWSSAGTGAVWLGLITALIVVRYWRGLPRSVLSRWAIGIALVLYTLAAYWSMLVEPSGLVSALGLAGVALVVVLGSYAYRLSWAMLGVAVVVATALLRGALHLSLPLHEITLFVTGLSGVVMYLLSAVVLFAHDRKRGNISLVTAHGSAFVAIIAGVPLYFRPAGEGILVGSIALLLLWTALLLMAVRTDRYAPWRRLAHAIFYPVFYGGALVMSMSIPVIWQAGVLAVGVALAWEASYRYRQGYLLILANLLMVWMTAKVWEVAGVSGADEAFGTFMVLTVLFYAAYGWFRYRHDAERRDSMLLSAWVCVCIAALVAMTTLEAWQRSLALGAFVAMAWHASYVHSRAYMLVVANVATVGVGVAIGDLLRIGDMTWYAALVAIAALWYGLYHYYRLQKDTARRDIMAVSTWVGLVGAWLASLTLDLWWQVAALIGIIGVLWEISYTYRRPWIVALANVALFWLFAVVVRWQGMGNEWSSLIVILLLTTVLYSTSVAMRLLGDEKRQSIMLWSVWLAVAIGYLTSVGISNLRAAASLLLIAGSISGVQEGLRRRKKTVVEIAVYAAVLGVMTLMHVVWPTLNSLWYSHTIAASIAIIAWWRGHDRTRYIIALGLMSIFSAGYALGEGGWYSLVFLVEHIAVTVTGVAWHRRWVAWWGAIGSVLAVFYYLRESPYLIFTLLGVLIVGFVVWRLTRKTTDASDRELD